VPEGTYCMDLVIHIISSIILHDYNIK
jgi:hypothetical protein